MDKLQKIQTQSLDKRLETSINSLIKDGVMDVATIYKQPQISSLVKEYGVIKITETLMYLIKDFSDAFKTDNKITPHEYSELCENLLTDYYHFRLEDFVLFFKRAKTGLYGKVYNRIDQAVIYEMLAKYDKERLEAREAMHHDEKGSSPKPLTPEMGKKFYDKFKATDEKKKKTEIHGDGFKKFVADYGKDPKAYMDKLKKNK